MNLRNYFLKHFYSFLKRSFPFIVIIVIIDLLPLYAILCYGWSAIEALYLYAIETIILLLIAFVKMWNAKFILAIFMDKAKQVAHSISTKSTNIMRFKLPRFSWAISGLRGSIYFLFLGIWLPLVILQLMLISLVSGDGFALQGFMGHNAGRLNLGLFSLNLMLVFLILLFIEHSYAYRNKYIGEKEYENTGVINEGVNYSIRIFIQQFVLIGLYALISLLHIDTLAMIIIILLKTLLDIVTYIFNRIWGSLKNKKEGKA